MEASNPYQAPDANLETTPGFDQYDTTSVFSPKGRFGRLSYLAWGMGIMGVVSMALSMLVAMGGATAATNPETFVLLSFVVQVPLMIFGFIFGVRRLHDIDMSGWWLLLSLVPLVNLFFILYMLFKRGTEGPNRFGAPRFTPTWEKVVGWILPAVVLIGILAASAIPAYQSYLQAAAQASGG